MRQFALAALTALFVLLGPGSSSASTLVQCGYVGGAGHDEEAGLAFCGYVGGAGADGGIAIAVDGAGSASLAGLTWSTEATFPVRVGPDLTFNDAVQSSDGFVARIRADGTGLVHAGYLGGSERD